MAHTNIRFDVVNLPVRQAVLEPGQGGVISRPWFRALQALWNRGYWTPVAFDAAMFTASSGSWTLAAGDQTTFRWAIIGRTLVLALALDTTTVSATPSELRVALPYELVAGSTQYGMGLFDENGTLGTLYWKINSGEQFLRLSKASGANWATLTDLTAVRLSATVEVQ